MDQYNPQAPYGIPHQTRQAAPSTFALIKKILPLEPSPSLTNPASRPYLPQPGPDLPQYYELDVLYRAYWSAVDPLSHVVHKPFFEKECRKYMLNGYVVDAAPASFKALLLAMCLAAAVSMPLVQQKELDGINMESVVGRLKVATEKALGEANFTTSVEIQTLQAFTIYLVGSCPIAS